MAEPDNKNNSDGGGRVEEEKGIVPFYPLHFMKEVMVMLCIIAGLLVMAAFFPAHLQAPADPFKTPPHIKPEWYFLPAYQMLKYFPAGELFKGLSFVSVGVLMTDLAVAFLAIVPFIDFYKGKKARKRPVFLALGIVAIVGALILMYLAYFSGSVDPLFHTHVK